MRCRTLSLVFVACPRRFLGCKRGNGPAPDLTNLVQPKGKGTCSRTGSRPRGARS